MRGSKPSFGVIIDPDERCSAAKVWFIDNHHRRVSRHDGVEGGVSICDREHEVSIDRRISSLESSY